MRALLTLALIVACACSDDPIARRSKGASERMRGELCAKGKLVAASCQNLLSEDQLRKLER